MSLARSLLNAATAPIAKLIPNRGPLPSEPLVVVVEHRDEFFANLSAGLKSASLRVERAVSAAQATQRLRGKSPYLILANCDLPDESGWLMVSKWCLARTPNRVWLYQAWPAPFDQEWTDLANVERTLYHKDDPAALADEVLKQLGLGLGPERRRPCRAAKAQGIMETHR